MAEKLLIFFISTFVQYGSDSFLRIETFTSTRICHFSKSASPKSFHFARRCNSFQNSTASSADEKSGSVTISKSGVQARLKSTRLLPFS
jgi:hypothetical protein